MATKLVHWELMGPDGQALVDFYSKVFGWTPQAATGFDSYHLVDVAQAEPGGAIGQGSEETPAYSVMYFEVDSIDEHLAKVAAAGGMTAVPRTEIPGTVVFALFKDPAGNLVGLVEPGTPPAGS
jgi:predicted enzyme related to lactoylglutathione lyase